MFLIIKNEFKMKKNKFIKLEFKKIENISETTYNVEYIYISINANKRGTKNSKSKATGDRKYRKISGKTMDEIYDLILIELKNLNWTSWNKIKRNKNKYFITPWNNLTKQNFN